MPYPISYRQNRAPSALNGRVRQFLGNTDGFVRFPGMDRRPVGHGPFGRPTGDPVAPSRPMYRPPDLPGGLQPPDPATRPQQDIPWTERGRGSLAPGRALFWGLLAWQAVNDYWPGGQFRFPYTPPPAGWTNVCGPTGWPGPPYRNSIRCFYSNSNTTTAFCGLGGQSMAGNSDVPLTTTRTIFYVWGPNTLLLPVERWYIDQQVRNAVAPGVILPSLFHYPSSIASYDLANSLPGVSYNVVPMPLPFNALPLQQVAPGPFVSTQGFVVDGPAPAPRIDTGGLSIGPDHPDVRPRPRDRERKLAPGVGGAFRFLSQVGSWHSMVDALWRSLPNKYTHRRRSVNGRIADLYQHWDELDIRKAVRNLFKFWLMYKAAGWGYGRAQKELVRLLGPQAGMQVYRGLVEAGAL